MLEQDGWLSAASKIASPNFDQRPNPQDISLLVIHNISLPPGEFDTGYIEQFFCNQLDCDLHPFFDEIRAVKVSAHFLIKRDGRLVQFVATSKRAWHAGKSFFQGRDCCNDFSIGIEMEGTDDKPYTTPQYNRLREVTLELMQQYPAIDPGRIVGHCDIAPTRKTDPGPAFDWARYKNSL
ncbi:MAG: 1,6-anhydro-N-acetylmuramyl-L-alanine amidase AmpD [Gammaproteobacteria bacterium]|nr:MAG: 1,6-anhydro-N-acetylmuramyl-L-alanine amidase AmpD [Gammaproteobacteria bacterium]